MYFTEISGFASKKTASSGRTNFTTSNYIPPKLTRGATYSNKYLLNNIVIFLIRDNIKLMAISNLTKPMNDNDELTGNSFDIFDIDFTKDLPDNKRYAVRYIRSNIKASVLKVRLFGLGKPIGLELLDISSKGALISTGKKIRKNKKITLILEFEDGKVFEIESKIVRLEKDQSFQYGVKFNRFNHDLGNYLLKTQDDLIFR